MAGQGSSSSDEPEQIRPLHGGRHSLSADAIAFNQRERLLGALAQTVAERGYDKVTIGEIADAASVSRSTFYEHFKGKEECFAAAYDAVDSYLADEISAIVSAQTEWPDRVAAVLAELVRFLASRPNLARLYLVEAFTVGAGMASRREASVGRIVSLLEAGRERLATERELPEGIEEALAGGSLTFLARRVLVSEAEQLPRFLPALIELTLAPYLDAEEVQQLIARHSS